jgi:hypothetical protein
MLTQEWAEFLENGVAMTMGVLNSQLITKAVRCVGAVVGGDRKTVTFYLPKDSALRVIPMVLENKNVAVVACLPSTYKTIQLKGQFLAYRDADSRDRIILERYRELFFYQTDQAGVPKNSMIRMRSFPALAMDVEITDLFLSTPGPQAGNSL